MSKGFAELSEREKENEQKSREYYAEEIQDYVQCFDLLDEVMREIANELRNGKMGKIDSKEILVFAICRRIMGTSKVFFDLVVKGYRYDAFILLRTMCENVQLLVWLMRDEKNIDEWRFHQGQRLTCQIRKELGLNSEGIRGSFRFLNDYVHSNIKALGNFVKTINGEHGKQIHISSEPQFRRDQDTKILLYPIVGKWILGVLAKNYTKLLRPETIIRIASVLEKLEKDTEQLFKI
jgi:hypothetical protein